MIPDLVSNAAIGKLVGLTERTIAGKKGQGGLPVRDGKIDLRALVLLGMEVAATHRGADDALELSAERARLAKEQADRLEMQNAQTRGDLLLRSDVDAAVGAAFARVRAKLLSVPTKVAAEAMIVDTPAESEAIIREAIYEALTELAETKVSDLMAQEVDED